MAPYKEGGDDSFSAWPGCEVEEISHAGIEFASLFAEGCLELGKSDASEVDASGIDGENTYHPQRTIDYHRRSLLRCKIKAFSLRNSSPIILICDEKNLID